MTLEVINSDSPQFQPSVVMLVYGSGGVGKTTFAATAPKPILADCENGAKYFGLRGIKNVPIARIRSWMDFVELNRLIKEGSQYETIIIDPIGELMEKLTQHMINKRDSKLVQNDGTPTMAGWGWLKKTLRDSLKILRDTGKHIIIIAHVQEKDDDGKIVKRPMVATKLSEELVNMVDIVGYMTMVRDGEETKRVIMVEPNSERFVAKDRTGQLGNIVPPDFTAIIQAATGKGDYEWMRKDAAKSDEKNDKPKGKPDDAKPAEGNQGNETPAEPAQPKQPEAPAGDANAEGVNERTRARLLIKDEEDIVETARLAGVTEEAYNDGYPDTIKKATKLYGAVLKALANRKSNGEIEPTQPKLGESVNNGGK